MLFKNINHTESCLGRSDIIAVGVVQTLGTASVQLVRAIGIAHTYRRLHVPVAREQPLIAIGDTGTYIPSFIMASALCLGQCAEGQVDVLDVIFAGKSMHTEETAAKALACPPTVFGLYVPETHLLAP